MLCLIDEYTREARAVVVKRRLNSHDVLETLADAMISRGTPAYREGESSAHAMIKVWALGPRGACMCSGLWLMPRLAKHCLSTSRRWRRGMTAASRLAGFAKLLAHARDRLSLDLGFVLWDGRTVPADLPPDMLAVSIADEGVVAALARRPNIDTLANLWVSGRVDIRNGSIFDLVERRPAVRSRALLRSLDKAKMAGTVARFLFVSRGGPFPLEDIRGDRALADGSEAANRKNVQYHYDASNEFYALFLDPSMVYTCAYYTEWNNDLATAQHDKLDMICRKLRLKPGETMLDIGCGWGALVCHAAKHYGVYAHGVTLSQEQYAYAQSRVVREGVADRVTLILRDYAKVEGIFDKISSIGMFEQVGLANHDTYFATVNRLLKPGGVYLHHSIARPAKRTDRQFRRRKGEYAALVRYIFPGGELDHIGMSLANLQRHGFEVHDVEGWREHYARTCRLWHDRLFARFDEAAALVGPVQTRLWLAYLAGCSIAFARNTVGIFQTVASKRVRGPASLPPTRSDLYVGPT
jgi:cyclopropane-fatty-acyl-phospholipid synthase